MSLPNLDQLTASPTISRSETDAAMMLKREHHFTTSYANVRFWLVVDGLADGHPYDATVYVEVRDYLSQDPAGRWYDLGHYDASEPPDSLGTYRASDLGE